MFVWIDKVLFPYTCSFLYLLVPSFSPSLEIDTFFLSEKLRVQQYCVEYNQAVHLGTTNSGLVIIM